MNRALLIGAYCLFLALPVGEAVAAEPRHDWQGFYAEAALGGRNTSAEVDDRFVPLPPRTLNFSDWTYMSQWWPRVTHSEELGSTEALGSIAGGWRWVSGPVVLGVGVSLDRAGSDGGHNTYMQSRGGWSRIEWSGGTDYSVRHDVYAETLELHQDYRLGVSVDVAPNWRTQPYVKLRFSWTEYELSSTSSVCDIGYTGPLRHSVDGNYTGLGLGGGLRHLFNDGLYLFTEVLWQHAGSESHAVFPPCTRFPGFPASSTSNGSEEIEVDPSSVDAVVGLGWRF